MERRTFLLLLASPIFAVPGIASWIEDDAREARAVPPVDDCVASPCVGGAPIRTDMIHSGSITTSKIRPGSGRVTIGDRRVELIDLPRQA